LLDTGKAMSNPNVEIVEGLFAASASMDKQALLALLPELSTGAA